MKALCHNFILNFNRKIKDSVNRLHRAAMDPLPDPVLERSPIGIKSPSGGTYAEPGPSPKRPKTRSASGASASDEVSLRSWGKGGFSAPATEPSRRALARAIDCPLPAASGQN